MMEARISTPADETDDGAVVGGAPPGTRYAVSWRSSRNADAGDELFIIEHNLHHLTALAARWLTRSLATRLAPHGVSAGQWPVLVHLWETDGLSQRELCERIDIEDPTMTRAIDGLERAGFVERVRIPSNRRRYNITLTPKGRSLRDLLLPKMNDMLSAATEGFEPEEVGRLRALLTQMIDWSRKDNCNEDSEAQAPDAR